MPRLSNSSSSSHIQAKNFFVTYSKCPAPKEFLLELFKSRSPKPNYIHIAREQHQDGSHHLHCFIQFVSKTQIRDPKKWDVDYESTSYHPNIQEAKNPQAVIDYINKEGDILKEGEYTRQMGNNQSTRANILAESSSAEEFLELYEQRQPKSFLLQYVALKRIANNTWPPKTDLYISPTYEFNNIPDSIHDWMMTNVCCFRRPCRPISLILEGPTRLGKTLWARSIGPHNYFHTRMDFRNYSNDARYNVIDNIEYKHCKYTKELLGCKKDWQADVKYRKPIMIKVGIPTIVFCNPDMSWAKKMSPSFREWLDCNAIYEYLNGALF